MLTLDVLRGVALAGIFLVNIAFFAMPLGEAVYSDELVEAPRSEVVAWAFVQVFAEFKFISLFSLMFGMGLVAAMARAEVAGRPFAAAYVRRLLTLGAIGLAHGLLLWYGDILSLYAVLGFLLLLCRRIQPKALLLLGAGSVALSMLLMTGLAGLGVLADRLEPPLQDEPADGEDAELDAADRDDLPDSLNVLLAAEFDPWHPLWREAETRVYKHGPFLDALAFRAVMLLFMLVIAAFSFGWRVLGLFLIGAALMKLAFFDPRRRHWHRRLAAAGLGVGLPLEILAAWLKWSGGFDFGWRILASALLHEAGSLLLCGGYAGLIALAVPSGALGPLTKPLASVGRMALTNYLMQTVVATAIMYWWGLGLFGEVSRPAQIGLVAAIFTGQMVFSMLWLQSFRFGPLEWLWRSVTYGRAQPLRRSRPG